ncbi:MAG: PQQ-dependent sugar dehydrogenase [Gemmatimonadaceae bacterium]
MDRKSWHGMVDPRASLRTLALLMAAAFTACAKTEGSATADSSVAASSTVASTAACAGNSGGITVPSGFCATVFADTIGHARHIAVNSNGDVYVNTWSGGYYTTPAHPGGFIVALRDTNNDGVADIVKRFGPDSLHGNGGGTGIAIYSGSVYAEESSPASARIVRYPLSSDSLSATSAKSETIVSGLPVSGGHPMHPFAIGQAGDMYVDLGSSTNSCQAKDRTLASPGRKPCVEMTTRAGIWKFDANRTNQRFAPPLRYATGIRNAVGIAFDANGQLYATQHGRDQLADNWPKLFTSEQGQNLPAEELLKIEKGADYGWPYCYYDGSQQKLVLAPEYGGDGKTTGDCATKKTPEAFFPAHWAPDGLVFYGGSSFPAEYKGGAFIAFHGSWNRAPGAQQGYNVVFVPFISGKPVNPSQYNVFAKGFAGAPLGPDTNDKAAHRPTGLAVGPDGALYITDDKAGRVWKVVYKGGSK